LAKPTIIIQARIGSRRFPKKVLAKIENKPMIWYVIERIKGIRGIKQVVLVTTKNSQDKILLKIAKDCNIMSFKGKTCDVLDRYYKCAIEFDADPIIRITGDCPLIDSKIIEKMLNFYMKHDYEYLSNIYPPTFPDGLDVEIFSFKTLEKLIKKAKLVSEKEHVTSYIRNHPKEFKIFNYENTINLSRFRWTIDERKDLTFVRTIYKKMRPKVVFSMQSVMKIISKDPNITKINSDISRNEGYLKSLKTDKKK
jgi:spore coat polysaccharide biosynthesis protein SpsF